MSALTPAVFHILLSLSGGERHGYGILKDVLHQTDNAVRLGPGMIYGTLLRLWVSGLVAARAGPAAAVAARRRHYRLTRSGRRALEDEVSRLEALVRVARAHRIGARTSRG